MIRAVRDGPDLRRDNFLEYIRPELSDFRRTINQSELVQEAVALRAQRQFLEQYAGGDLKRGPGWRSLPQKVTHHGTITAVLSGETEAPYDESLSMNHALGDWLADRFRINPGSSTCLNPRFAHLIVMLHQMG